jgi:hypothetical protein
MAESFVSSGDAPLLDFLWHSLSCGAMPTALRRFGVSALEALRNNPYLILQGEDP